MDRLDPDRRRALLLELLEQHPGAAVTAIDAGGLFTAMPPSVPLGGHQILVNAESALDLVVPDDQLAVLQCWEGAVRDGFASVIARFVDPPHELVDLCAVDVVEAYGCFIGIMRPATEGQTVMSPADHPSRRARVARLQKDRIGIITGADPTVAVMLGWTEEELVGHRSLEFAHPDDKEIVVASWLHMMAHPDSPQTHRIRHQHRDGHYVWLEVTNYNRLGPDETGPVLCDIIDISEEMAATEALREREELLHRLTQALPLGVLQIDAAHQVVFTNDRLHEILRSPRADALAEQLGAVLAEDRDVVHAAVTAVLTDADDRDVEVRFGVDGDADRLGRVSIRPLLDEAGVVAGAILTVEDVTEQARLHHQLHDRATHDALTRCLNRTSIMAAVTEALADHDEAAPSGTAAIFIDLDRFKPINDRLGHAAGDTVLRAVAHRIREEVRETDVVGRLGGDEFLVLCRHVDTAEDAHHVARRIADRLHHGVDLGDVTTEIRASVGVTWTERPDVDPASFVAEADAAMYESKRQGAGEPVIFGPKVQGASVRSFDEERRLRRALANGELAVHYQPIVELATGRTAGFEALLRWCRDDRIVSAGEFIELAEQTGSIHEIGAWVLDTVCRDAAAAAAGHPELCWTANVSPLQIATPGLADHVRACIERHGLDPRLLVLEVTEHHLLGGYAAPRQTIESLRRLGVGLALDDFGTGWSSFELLRQLPVDCIKIPRPFIADITGNDRTMFLVESLVTIGTGLGSFIVAEGVEEPEQRERLLAAGVELCQGWLYAPAMPLDDALRTLTAAAY